MRVRPSSGHAPWAGSVKWRAVGWIRPCRGERVDGLRFGTGLAATYEDTCLHQAAGVPGASVPRRRGARHRWRPAVSNA